MELKGKMVDRLPPHKRELMEKTLNRMKETRRKDDMFLRDVIKEKLEWAKVEKQKGFNTIDALKERIKQAEGQIKNVENQMLKLDGIILVLNELIVAKTDEEKKVEAEAAEKARADAIKEVEAAKKVQEAAIKKEAKKVKKISEKKKVAKKTTKKITKK